MSDEPSARPAGELARAALRTMRRRVRLRQGWRRVHASFWPVVQASLAAGVAYGIAILLLGHPQPFFAAVAAWVCLGFSFDRDLRRVAEVAVGVALGVGLGDLLVHLIGSGWWQLSVVMAVSALLARFVDRGALLATQAGVQAIVVVGLPVAVTQGGVWGRWTDALTGGAVALLVALLTPGDPRRRLRKLAGDATDELASVLELVARGLRDADVDDIAGALVRGRGAETALTDWRELARKSREIARVSVNRVHREELTRLASQAVLVDRAMRGVRVLARRSPAALRSLGLLDDDGAPTGELPAVGTEPAHHPVADLVDRYAVGVRLLASALGAGIDPARARETLSALAADVDPRVIGEGYWQVQSLVLLLRSPVVDTLEAAGMTPEQARAALPEM
ncbi:FUSC family protein [Isoptericola sp. NEAU-Y5]|uniref:FUSC family protein n=1 Tax=Isoptericola luteus TaxID=2879484 RepID=A0ABS7ZKL9_9MICO|nr:FUSC family protein [Isoptericola sp. NEAU-Y5]MCA5894394.1 FUSC family protein [Isoptericola sp. NEAU-Y5]